MKYYRIRCKYEYVPQGGDVAASDHVIRAENEQKAIEIAERHDIRAPDKEAPLIKRIVLEEADERTIKRRRNHIGGKLYYEDENGDLKHE